jgi:hypothetical protein
VSLIGPSHRCVSHRRVSHRRASSIGNLIGMSLTGVYSYLSHRLPHRRSSPIDHYLIGVFLIGASLIDVFLTDAIS